MSYETADILDSAADKIERDGWHQGGYAPAEGRKAGDTFANLPVCALGAIAAAQGRGQWDCDLECWVGVRDRVNASVALAVRLDVRPHKIPDWNDAPERTEQEVLDALRGAAKAERRAADEVAS